MKHPFLRSLARRATALLLCAALLMPMTARAAVPTPVLITEQTVMDGLTYRNTVSTTASGRVESFAVALELRSELRPILLQSSGTIYGGASIDKAAELARSMGLNVYAAINTDYFSTATGVPQGIVIEDGVYKSDPVDTPAILVVDDEVVLCEEPKVSLTLTNKETGAEIVPNYFNKYRASTGGVYLLNEHFSTVSTRTTTPGWFVLMKVVDYDPDDKDCQLTVNSKLNLEVIDMFRADQPIAIREGEYILTADDVSNKGDVFQAFHVGDRITLKTQCKDRDLADAQWAGGAGDVIVQKSKVTDLLFTEVDVEPYCFVCP